MRYQAMSSILVFFCDKEIATSSGLWLPFVQYDSLNERSECDVGIGVSARTGRRKTVSLDAVLRSVC